MIRYALVCHACDHEFQSWFASSNAYDKLQQTSALGCPACGNVDVGKAVMAPAVKSRDTKGDAALETLARKARAHISKNYEHVGDKFADEARAMYFGEKEMRPIWGEATLEERDALRADGVPAAPLPAPFAPETPKKPEDLN